MVAQVEPWIRIGIVLPEDGKRSMRFVLPAGDVFLLLSAGGRGTYETNLGLAGCVTIDCNAAPERRMILELGVDRADGNAPERLVGEFFSIVPQKRQELKAGVGIQLRELIAGRSFHWEKEIDQTLPGAIHFYRSGASLVVVDELPLEFYLAGVVTAEMAGESPKQFAKAQAIVARSWCLANAPGKHGELFTHCNDDCCQRFQGTAGLTETALAAVAETRATVLIDGSGKIPNANYAKCCGGIMADAKAIWTAAGETSRPAGNGAVIRNTDRVTNCAGNVEDAVKHDRTDAPPDSAASDFFPITERNAREWLTGAWLKTANIFCSPAVVPEAEMLKYLGRADEAGSYFRWNIVVAQETLAHLLRTRAGIEGLRSVTGLEPVERESSGRITVLDVVYVSTRGESMTHRLVGESSIRRALSSTFLFSSAFMVDVDRELDGRIAAFRLRGGGWGHGVGMCQIGALGMALKGYGYEDILHHYYPHAALTQLSWHASPSRVPAPLI